MRQRSSAPPLFGVGRPHAYNLVLGGEDGIVHILRTLLAGADPRMAVDGYPTITDFSPNAFIAPHHSTNTNLEMTTVLCEFDCSARRRRSLRSPHGRAVGVARLI